MNARTPAEALGSGSLNAGSVHADLAGEDGEAVQRQDGNAEKLARMWLGTHYADEYEREEIEALCWKILGVPGVAPERPEQKASPAARRSDDTEHAHTALSLALKASDAALQAMEELTPTALVMDCLEALAKAHTFIEDAQALYGKWEPLSAIEYEGRKL